MDRAKAAPLLDFFKVVALILGMAALGWLLCITLFAWILIDVFKVPA